MTYDLVIKSGLLIMPADTFIGDLAIDGEQIAALGQGLRGRREIDATGLYVLPGAIDGHVHLTDPTFPPYALPTADSFATGGIAAAFGGTTTLIDFAQPAPGQPLLAALESRLSDAADCPIDYGLHLNLRDSDPARLEELPAIFARGVPSLKLYTTYEGYRLPDGALLRAMQAVATLGGLAIVHAENDGIIAELQRQHEARGQRGPRWHAATRPPEGEAEAVQRVLTLALIAGARLLIFHISCAEAVRELHAARARGQDAWGETCPHYLALTDRSLQTDNDYAQSLMVLPPIRDESQRQSLWRALVHGDLEIVSSDHCPRQPLPDHHPPGISGIEPRLALLHNFGVREGLISLSRWAMLCCTNPARVFGLQRKGRLTPGYDADVVLFDPKRELMLSPETLHSPLPFSSYQGIRLIGAPMLTISRGEVIVEGGAFVGQVGRGQFITRSYH